MFIARGDTATPEGASAAKCRARKADSQIKSDLLDIASELSDFRTVRSVLAYELGHANLCHISIWRMILGPVNTILTLRPSITRAQEHLANRVGCYSEPERARGTDALFAERPQSSNHDQGLERARQDALMRTPLPAT